MVPGENSWAKEAGRAQRNAYVGSHFCLKTTREVARAGAPAGQGRTRVRGAGLATRRGADSRSAAVFLFPGASRLPEALRPLVLPTRGKRREPSLPWRWELAVHRSLGSVGRCFSVLCRGQETS